MGQVLNIICEHLLTVNLTLLHCMTLLSLRCFTHIPWPWKPDGQRSGLTIVARGVRPGSSLWLCKYCIFVTGRCNEDLTAAHERWCGTWRAYPTQHRQSPDPPEQEQTSIQVHTAVHKCKQVCSEPLKLSSTWFSFHRARSSDSNPVGLSPVMFFIVRVGGGEALSFCFEKRHYCLLVMYKSYDAQDHSEITSCLLCKLNV